MMRSPNSQLVSILQSLLAGSRLTAAQQRQLQIWALQDPLHAKAFGIDSENVVAVLQKRSQLLQRVYPQVQQLWHKTFQLQSSFLELLWNLWLPLALQLVTFRQQLDRPLIQGILGSQGTGKSTLAATLTVILNHLGYPTVSLSLDDLYKTYAERQRLQQQDSRLIWRGPPGTHDVELGLQVLDQLQNFPKLFGTSSVQIPRFDKSAYGGRGDRTTPQIVNAVEIVLFEGWFVGVRPINPAVFASAPPPITTAADRIFAQDMNLQLHHYLPLWERLDHLMLLYLLDYRFSQQWRRQAEHQAIAAGQSGMQDAEINQFVEYFWRALHPDLFIKPLTQNPQWVDLVIEINSDHCPSAVYHPADQLA